MTFDALTLSAVRDELHREVLGGAVQRVALTTPLTLGMEIYAGHKRHFLVCSAEAETARVNLSEVRPIRESDRPTSFLLLLRKYVRGGRIADLQQPPYERLLKLRITKRDEQGRPGEIWLIIETMGRRSNVVLVGADGAVLDALRRSSPARNARRPILPRLRYQEPPPQPRLDPLVPATMASLAQAAAEAPDGTKLAELLGTRLAGFSPLAAREVSFRATGSVDSGLDAVDWPVVESSIRELLAPLETHQWDPTVCRRDGQVSAFAPYRLTHRQDCALETVASISRAIELALGNPAAAPRALPVNRVLVGQIDELRSQTERKLAALERSLEQAEAASELRQAGEAILANLDQILPGDAAVEFDGRRIELDPRSSALENAQRYFREYRKARDAARQVPRLLEETRLRTRQLDELRVLAEVAAGLAQLEAIRDELRQLDSAPEAEPTKPGKRRPKDPSHGRVARQRTPDGLEVLVGTSGRGNDLVTFKLANPDDLWLHARGVPGAHVILRTAGREPSSASLRFAAELAASNSQARTAGQVQVDYTPRKRVRKIPGAPPGLVSYAGEGTLTVRPAERRS